jgi:hypothetical protein
MAAGSPSGSIPEYLKISVVDCRHQIISAIYFHPVYPSGIAGYPQTTLQGHQWNESLTCRTQ